VDPPSHRARGRRHRRHHPDSAARARRVARHGAHLTCARTQSRSQADARGDRDQHGGARHGSALALHARQRAALARRARLCRDRPVARRSHRGRSGRLAARERVVRAARGRDQPHATYALLARREDHSHALRCRSHRVARSSKSARYSA
jgi:hypothetical protein